MLINKHNHNHDPRHTQLPRTSRSHRTQPSASRHALSSSQFSAEKNVREYVLHWTLLPNFLIDFFHISYPEKKKINSSNFRKHSKTWRYWEICLKEDLNYRMNIFFSRNEAMSTCKPSKSTYVEYDLSSLRAGLENFIFHFGNNQIFIRINWAFFS